MCSMTMVGQLGQAGRQVEEAVGIGPGEDGVHNQAMSPGLDTEVDLFSQVDDGRSAIVVDGGLQYGKDAAHNSAHRLVSECNLAGSGRDFGVEPVFSRRGWVETPSLAKLGGSRSYLQAGVHPVAIIAGAPVLKEMGGHPDAPV